MKRLTVIIVLLLVLFMLPLPVLAEKPIKLIVNGEEIETEIPLQLLESTTMAPIRVIGNIFDAEIIWDEENEIVSLGYNDTGIALAVDHKSLYKVTLQANGELEYETLNISMAPQLIDGRVYVPVKYIAWAFGAYVEWNSEQYAVSISTNNKQASRQQPDKPQYGAEPIKGPQDYVEEILNSIDAYRAENPIYTPFPPGTKTLPSTSPTIISGAVTSNYWVSEIIDFGQYVLLNDGSLWGISLFDKITTSLWLPVDGITIIPSDDLQYPFILINTTQGETAKAKFIGK